MLYTEQVHAALFEHGVESFLTPGTTHIPEQLLVEPPCSLKWMTLVHDCSIGAFSYGVSGYFMCVQIGRYVSMGEQIQVGRGAHPTAWMSTSPFFYCQTDRMFNVGTQFAGSADYMSYASSSPCPVPEISGKTVPNFLRPTIIGHDVWIGHGAFIAQGVTIGNGAVVAGHAVVTKDVPPYAIVAGNPAEIKRFRFNERQVEQLQQVAWWRYAPWDLRDIDYNKIDLAIEQLQGRVPGLKEYQPRIIRAGDLVTA